MRLTAAHVRFWQSKRAPMPASFARLVRMPPIEDIHWLINVQEALTDPYRHGDTHNLMNVLRRHRGRERKVADVLKDLSTGCCFGDRDLTRWEANCVKWLRRIERVIK